MATHWWPYGFVNVDQLGLLRVVAIFAGLLVFFLIVGLVVVAIDRSLRPRDRTPVSA